MFISYISLAKGSWQAFERNICRLLLYQGYDDIRLVGNPGDKGADILAHKGGKRWLFQAKHWKNRVGVEVIDQTIKAIQLYRANIPAIISLNGFDDEAREHQLVLMSRGIPLQLISGQQLAGQAASLPLNPRVNLVPKDYQEEAIRILLESYNKQLDRHALVVMATGLGKTVTIAEMMRRISAIFDPKVLVIAHTNEIVYQLERAFWPFLSTKQQTAIWNGYEQPGQDELHDVPFIFACLNSIASYLEAGKNLPAYDVIVVDECHHVGGKMYQSILQYTLAGKRGGPFLIGLTATPWRPDETDLREIFGDPLICVDMITGLKRGFLSNIDYRMYTDNIKWSSLAELHGSAFSPKYINRTLFISQWDDAVVFELKKVWQEQSKPRCIVFCGTIDHAITMRDRINAMGFCNSAAIYSQTNAGGTMSAVDRARTLCDFHDGIIDVICAVDIFNEGVDVPDVNIIVFQRVTHSRRIFIQQLGRGLRIAKGKQKVIVLDFVSDIRRFAAGIDLKDNIEGKQRGKIARLSLPNKVTFCKVGGEDPESETFLREWLKDVAAIEDAGEDSSVLKYPPRLSGGR